MQNLHVDLRVYQLHAPRCQLNAVIPTLRKVAETARVIPAKGAFQKGMPAKIA